MSKKLTSKCLVLMLFFVLCVGTRLQGQFIDIPDANFRARLQTLYPACFGGVGGNQLNTSCPAVTSANTLNVQNLNITNLIGVGAFTNLQTLNCSSNQLTSLPTLPMNLQFFSCYDNQLASLPVLPANLQILY